MSGAQGSEPGHQWQPPGQSGDHSSEPTQVGSSWQQQPGEETTWQAPAYTPPAE
ncbi:MAG TPA: hypothetical protein VMS84_13760, partial [Mycobacterium sp.]|nr:hypothetical protein [Mycobacterium sp.]